MTHLKHMFLFSCVATLALALSALPARAQAVTFELYHLGGDEGGAGWKPENPRPVLFVHGHDPDHPSDADFNFRKNWVSTLGPVWDPLPSFDMALMRNPHLGIEPYYIRLADQNRSIADDAAAIAQAIDDILEYHDDPEAERIKVAIVANSKGTISSRLYLKQHHAEEKVSALVAIAPPNHGLTSRTDDSLSLKQLNNGYTRVTCCRFDQSVFDCLLDQRSCASDEYAACDFDASRNCPGDFAGCDFNDAQGLHFIECLNGHSLCDTKEGAAVDQDEKYRGEAPGSRSADAPIDAGILYFVLGAADNDDLIAGGESPSDDCLGRRLAMNLAPDAVNRWLPVEAGWGFGVHEATPHTPQVICQALYAAAYGQVPDESYACELGAGQVPEIAPPAQVMLALDLSGSMSGSCPDCDGRPKVQYLRDAVTLFFDLWKSLNRPQDRVGAVYFRTGVEPFDPQADELGSVATQGPAIASDLSAETPSGFTAMGRALIATLGTLLGLPPETAGSRHVILFTDGMQNRNPMVVENDGKLAIEDDPSKVPFPTDRTLIDLDDLDGIKIHTVGIGAGGAANELLSKIATQTGGSFLSSVDPNDLQEFFAHELLEALRGLGPQMVSYRRGMAPAGGQATETFAIGGGARKLIFMSSADSGEVPALRVKKDGRDLTAYGKPVKGPFYRILAFDLPLAAGRETIEAEGQWQLVTESARSGEALVYQAAAIVDGDLVQAEASVGPTPQLVRRPLELEVGLKYGDLPVTGADVSARIFRSGTAVGTLLATSPMPSRLPRLDADVIGGQKKLEALIVQKDVWEQVKLEPLGIRVKLEDRGDGSYRGSCSDIALPGTYKVTFSIRGSDPVGRDFARTEIRFAQVTVGTINFPDIGLATQRLKTPRRSADAGVLKLTLRPRDEYGNYLGPDYADRIRVLAGGTAAPVVDLLDGSYEVTVPASAGEDPELELSVLGRCLFTGSASELAEGVPASRWNLSAHLGLILPAGTLDRFYDPGPLAEIDLEYAVSPRLALHGVIGRYRFDPTFDVDGATLYLRAYRPWKSPAHRPGSTRLFAEIGPGVYHPDGLSSTAGASAGFGVVRRFRPRLESELGAAYFHLFTSGDDLRFFALKTGLRYVF